MNQYTLTIENEAAMHAFGALLQKPCLTARS